MALDLTPATGRHYRSTQKPPGAGTDWPKWTALVSAVGAMLGIALVVYVLIFANPARSENVIALLAVVGFTVLFGAWSIGHGLRTGIRSQTLTSTWPITRQSLIAAFAVVALVASAVNQIASPAVLASIVIASIASELVLGRMSVS